MILQRGDTFAMMDSFPVAGGACLQGWKPAPADKLNGRLSLTAPYGPGLRIP
jgi:hypothetical protein